MYFFVHPPGRDFVVREGGGLVILDGFVMVADQI